MASSISRPTFDDPVIPVTGLEVRIESGKAHYYALASNKYGLAPDSYVGDFMPLVSMGQADGSSAETGGIVLAGPVVKTLIDDKLASIATDPDRWIVALPIDIRSSFARWSMSRSTNSGLSACRTRRVWSFTSRAHCLSWSPSRPIGGFHVLVEQLGATAWQVIDPVRLGIAEGASDPAHVMNQLVVYAAGPERQERRRRRWQGDAWQLMLKASGDVSVSLVVSGNVRTALDPDKVLTVGDVPVFVASS